jgi:hypothetical protein
MKRDRRRGWLGPALFVCGATLVAAPPVGARPAAPMALDHRLNARVDRYLEGAPAAFEVPGAAVAMVRGNAVACTRGIGVRDQTTGHR